MNSTLTATTLERPALQTREAGELVAAACSDMTGTGAPSIVCPNSGENTVRFSTSLISAGPALKLWAFSAV